MVGLISLGCRIARRRDIRVDVDGTELGPFRSVRHAYRGIQRHTKGGSFKAQWRF